MRNGATHGYESALWNTTRTLEHVIFLTHLCQMSHKMDFGKQFRPEQTLQNTASDICQHDFPLNYMVNHYKNVFHFTRLYRCVQLANHSQASGHMTLVQRRFNVDATSWRCIDVQPTLYKHHVPAGKREWFAGVHTSIKSPKLNSMPYISNFGI